MINFQELTVEIKDKPFTNKSGVEFSSTAYATFRDPEKKKSIVKKYGFIEIEDVFKKIEGKESLNLDNCYIHKFNLSRYRKSRNINEESFVELVDFSASDCLFNTTDVIDFSFCDFKTGDVSFENSIFVNGNLNFHGARFGKGAKNFTYLLIKAAEVDFSNVKFGLGDVDFKNSFFSDGFVNFQFAEFGEGEVSFINTEFNNGDVSFINTVFGDGDVSFKIARFGNGRVDFHYSKVGRGNVTFERTEFGHGFVNFKAVEFQDGRVNFNRSVFGDCDIDFEGFLLKKGRFNFKKAIMGKGNLSFVMAEMPNSEVCFDGTDFGEGDVSFYKTVFKELSLKECHLDHYLDLRVQKVGFIDLSYTIARDIIDLKPYDFEVKIEQINFEGMRLLGRIYLDWQSNNVKKLIFNQKDTSVRSKAEQFRILKQNFNVTGQYDDEDKAYVEFKRMESIDIRDAAVKENPISKLWHYPAYFFKWLVFDKIGLYATDPMRVFTSIIFIYFFFSLFYIILAPLNIGTIINADSFAENPWSYVGDAFYYSGVTFFTIGYGDYSPSHLYRVIAIIEGFVGVFMMAYFTVAFVRKILR